MYPAFLDSGPKGPMSCKTQGGISRRPEIQKADLRPGGLIRGLGGRFEILREDLRSGGQI